MMKQDSAPQNSNRKFSDLLASKLGKGMLMRGSMPIKQAPKIEVDAPSGKGEANYQQIIETKTTKVVKKKKPKRSGAFETGKEFIPIVKKPEPVPEENKISEAEELKQEEPKNEEPKNEEQKNEEQKNEEANQDVNGEPTPPKPQVQQDKVPQIKNSVFTIFTEDNKPKGNNLFEKVELDSNNELNKNTQNNNKLNFLNDDEQEVHKSTFVIDNSEKKKEQMNKKMKAFFGDDDDD